ncbi:MAG: LysM peptidoglycan-binding domain-containing protein, partial [Prevotella sp.]|nr:LysM peptidoglycan-binding domain-containing protein [Prevotella sp.]
FGDWNLVIAAYNCGPGNVNKAILRSNGKADYWSIYPYLPRETRGYVPAFIAANYVMNYYCEHNICPMRTKLPAKSDTIMLTRDVHFKQISDICGIDIEELRTLNPQYRRDIVNGGTKPSSLRLPASLISTFINNEDTIYNHQADVLFTRRSLVEVNDDPVSTSSSNKYKSKKKRSRRSKSVTVRKGQTLSEIARRHGTTVSKLRRLNGIKGSNIRAGKKIRVR